MRARESIALLSLMALSACRIAAKPATKEATRGAIQALQEQAPEGEVGKQIAKNTAEGMLEALSQPEQLKQLRKVMGAAGAGALEGASSQSRASCDCGESPQELALRGQASPQLCSAIPAQLCPTSPVQPCSAAPPQAQAATPIEKLAQQSAETFVDTFAAQLIAQLGQDGQGPLSNCLAATSERLSASVARGMASGVFPECQGPERPQCIEQRLQELGKATSTGVAQGFSRPMGLLLAFAGFLAGLVAAAAISVIASRAGARRSGSQPA